MTTDYRNRRATIMGLGHFGGGVAAARWLAKQGAAVTVTDLADERVLADSLDMLNDVPIAALHLGGHREEDFRDADLVVVNPAVRPDNYFLDVARKSDATLRTEIELFMENCPARIVGVTGSNGKSTTAAMIAEIFQTTDRRTFLGGNIGGSLLDQLPRITANDWVVLELSSFQLRHFSQAAKMPHIAVVTGCTPNHLDWHGDFDDYVAAKQRIFIGQTPNDFVVLNTLDEEVASWRPPAPCRVVTPYNCEELPRISHQKRRVGQANHCVGGASVAATRFVKPQCATSRLIGLRSPTKDLRDFDPSYCEKCMLPPLLVPGEHNRINAACAAAAAKAAGCGNGRIRQGLQKFSGLPMRLELIAEIHGRRFYNDSTSTTPESTVAALRSFDAPVWLMAGGANKGCDFKPMAAEIVRLARGAAFFGTVGKVLRDLVASIDRDFPCFTVKNLDESLAWCGDRCRSGEAVVLSPGCAGTDQFQNYRRRGERFNELVGQII